jgi:nickel superoxide dismutase
MEKYAASDDPQFRERAVLIKEQRADLEKQHLWVLWTDYFKPEHLDEHPGLHDLFWEATKAAGATKKSLDPADAQKVIDLVDRIDEVFKATKKS